MKSFAVVGLGRFGRAVAEKLFEMGCEVVAIDKDMDVVNGVADRVTKAVCADLKENGVIAELGMTGYDAVVVAMTELSDSILITLMLKEAGVKKVVCKAKDANHMKALQKIGADFVEIPEQNAGIKTAVRLVSSNVFDLLDASGRYSIADVRVPKKWRGKDLVELNLRREYGVNVIAVKNAQSGKVSTILPSPEYRFTEHDTMVILGETKVIDILNKL